MRCLFVAWNARVESVMQKLKLFFVEPNFFTIFEVGNQKGKEK